MPVISIHLDDETLDEIDECVDEQDISRSKWIKQACRRELDHEHDELEELEKRVDDFKERQGEIEEWQEEVEKWQEEVEEWREEVEEWQEEVRNETMVEVLDWFQSEYGPAH